jgi:transcriptional regulator with XRE-family HTH domain
MTSQRKRLALSQHDVAFLMGTHGGAGISRYEQSSQLPNLETALALEAILQTSIKDLFSGLYEEVLKRVVIRAQTLMYKNERGRSAIRKRRSLTIIISLRPVNARSTCKTAIKNISTY